MEQFGVEPQAGAREPQIDPALGERALELHRELVLTDVAMDRDRGGEDRELRALAGRELTGEVERLQRVVVAPKRAQLAGGPNERPSACIDVGSRSLDHAVSWTGHEKACRHRDVST